MVNLKSKRKLLLCAIDTVIFAAVYAMTLFVNMFSGAMNPSLGTLPAYMLNCVIFFVCIFSARFFLSVYSNIWRYANTTAFVRMIAADFIGGIVAILIAYVIPFDNLHFWISCAMVSMVDVATLLSRFVYQIVYRSHNTTAAAATVSDKLPVAIIGAGQVGSMLAEELIMDKRSIYKPVCFLDHDKDKIGSTIQGIKVYPENDTALKTIEMMNVKVVLIAIPGLDEERTEAFLDFYSKSGCPVKIYDFPIKSNGVGDGEAKRVIRDVRIEDLLFRDPLKVVDKNTAAFYENRVVLVTGGGGSIGSELCRQIAKFSPKKLIIFDIYENNAYDIQQELIRKYGDSLDLSVEIGSVRDRIRLEAVFNHYRPEVVFHAAAHKHVPLMEHSNCEAIKNNVLGTYNTADMAEKYGVKKFILISTDKAVNPTNVMGASKRMCEMVIQCRRDSDTVFAAVRFGNVLGSNGSVIPLFRKQIASGGPITVTDKRIIRYFMTIPEASGLVLQAGAIAKRGELLVLDMGKPVKIIDLAENMIKLSGLNPYIDIDIIETGLRPGEKLYEELLIKTERLDKTDNNMIFIERDTPNTREEIEKKLEILKEAVKEAENDIASPIVTNAMKSVVPTFYSPEEVNEKANSSDEMKMVYSK